MAQPRSKRRIAGLTCGQILLLFLLVVALGLGAAFVFGYSLGIFDRLDSPPAVATESVSPTMIDAAPEATDEGLTPTPEDGEVTEIVTLDPSVSPEPSETASVTFTVTSTSPPPPTAPANVCAQIDVRFSHATSNVIAWRIGNPTAIAFTLSRIEIQWPASNDAIFNAFLDGDVIWSGQDMIAPTIITTWIGNSNERTLTSLSRLEFFFGTDAATSGYNLTLRFENGCEVSASR